MTERKAIPTPTGPLEDYAAQFDYLWVKAAQRESFRAYLQGLLLPRDRNKTLTALAGARPIEDAQYSRVQKPSPSSPSPPGIVKPSTPAAWSCSWMTSAPFPTRRTVRTSTSSSPPMAVCSRSSRPILGLWRQGSNRRELPSGLVTKLPMQIQNYPQLRKP
jgi:hypothetical protein